MWLGEYSWIVANRIRYSDILMAKPVQSTAVREKCCRATLLPLACECARLQSWPTGLPCGRLYCLSASSRWGGACRVVFRAADPADGCPFPIAPSTTQAPAPSLADGAQAPCFRRAVGKQLALIHECPAHPC